MKNIITIFLYILILLNFSCSPISDTEKWVKKEKFNRLSNSLSSNNVSNNKNKKTKFGFKFQDYNYKHPKNISVSPFDSSRLNLFDIRAGRKKEILENFSLNDLVYLGYFKKSDNTVGAYIKANNIIYKVNIGNYIGENGGRITDITQNKIVIDEIVINENGESDLQKNEILISSSF